MKKLYLCVTGDEYELPLIVEDSPMKLAEKLGVDKRYIYNLLRHKTTSRRTFDGYRYRAVVVRMEDYNYDF